MEDFANILTYEIKEDLAKRYFGSRKQIENDKAVYFSSLNDSAAQGKLEIVHAITAIYTLLSSAELCSSFFQFTGLPEEFLNTPLQPRDVAAAKRQTIDLKRRGFTRKRRYRNTLYHLYSLLEQKVTEYREKFAENLLFYEDICDDIKKFGRNFDLTTIFQFLREIDDPDRGRGAVLNYLPQDTNQKLVDNNLEISPPDPPQTIMIPIEPIQSLERATNRLQGFAEKGYAYTFLRREKRTVPG